MNAVDEMANQKKEPLSLKSELNLLMKYFPPQSLGFNDSDPWAVNIMSAQPLVRDVEKYFQR